MNDKNNSIKCDVYNCKHNDETCCCAPQIKIGPSFATTCSDTVCQTFKQK